MVLLTWQNEGGGRSRVGQSSKLVCCYNNGFTTNYLFQDGVNVLRPNEWFLVCVIHSDIVFNGMDQIREAAEHTTANPLAGDLPKPSFNQIQPRGGSRREVAMKAWMLFQPRLDLGLIVCTVVIQNYVDG